MARGRNLGDYNEHLRLDVPSRMRTFYDQSAEYYIAKNSVMHRNLQELADEFSYKLPKNSKILDAGCGHGRDMAHLEKMGYKMTGLDISKKLLEHAKKQVKGELVEGELTKLPFEDQTFDGIWSMASLIHLPKKDLPIALSEFRRVLKPGGLAAICVKEGFGEGWENSGSVNESRYFAKYTADDFEKHLKDANFEVQNIRTEHGLYDDWLTVWAKRSD